MFSPSFVEDTDPGFLPTIASTHYLARMSFSPRSLVFLLLFYMQLIGGAQAQWTWTPLAPLPMPTANHALCAAVLGGQRYVYAFGGITTGLSSSSIHQNCFKYDVALDSWSALPDLPDTLGKIASAASVVGDTAYVIGGYHVFAGTPFERSSDRVHRLDLSTDTWMSDGAAVPVPIDDQVQAVWRDSLIYVITGWSNTTNVPNVQVYDPALDQWQAATPVPNNNQFKAFGASGVIIGDTIFYHGGASTGSNFPALDRLRIGIIDPLDPTQIAWQAAISGTAFPRYRSGALVANGRPLWLGGSAVSYNYDALAYAGGAVVEPVEEVLNWDGDALAVLGNAPVPVMDLRGVGDLANGFLVMAGGIGLGREVLDGTWLLEPLDNAVVERDLAVLQVFPVPASEFVRAVVPDALLGAEYLLLDPQGRTLRSGSVQDRVMEISVQDLVPGLYLLCISRDDIRVATARLVVE